MSQPDMSLDMGMDNARRNARMHGIIDATLSLMDYTAHDGTVSERVAAISGLLRKMVVSLKEESTR